ncbi:dienelactone hydrolase [Fusarium napiforme]|uniref:Dienelactone hydrolase n=1 Tax=Fusarium napiforme TaxID=42672 RepID=A0A8H5JB88_9HYPO|nr:dienelactone hydrolase [Fusarium napiforme]
MDNVLAKPADLCCLKGSFHSGDATGSTIQIDGIDTYVAKPYPDKSNGNVLLFFPDAFGLHINSFLMMDAFAECGYLTLGVDYFLGGPVTKHSLTPLSDPNFDFELWKNKHLKASEDVAVRWVKAVKAQYGSIEDVKFACVGYCWGARFVCQQLSADGICKVGAIAHPSFLKESDVFYAQGEYTLHLIESKLTEQSSRTIEILTENNKQFNMQVFSNVGHGFASRARLTDPYEKWAKEASFKSFVDWFDFWMEKR